MRALLLFKESAQVAYGGEARDAFPEKDLVKAQFAAELTGRLGYPSSFVRVDVPVIMEGGRFHCLDILAENKRGEAMIAAAVEAPQDYEACQARVMRGLYLKASALARTKRVHWLVYYTRRYQKGLLQKRQITVDYAKYPTYHAWKAAGFPSAGAVPGYSADI